MRRFVFAFAICAVVRTVAAQEPDLAAVLKKPILEPRQTLVETQAFCEKRIAKVPDYLNRGAWDKYVKETRQTVLDKVVYRGEAAKWRSYRSKVEEFDPLPGGPEYRMIPMRFEALPGLWIPAMLYEPLKLDSRVPCHLCVMGHDGGGKDVAYQQIRCINLAKRGMLVLNVEWFNFGQLKDANFHHGRMNQLDLCGTAGLAPFYLSLKRGLDVLLAQPGADRERVSVSGLSGGGWQTIIISGLDERVTLSNPVAGYSSFFTRVKHFMDLGDSEQTPCDLGMYADYHHLTCFRAPQPTLLTYNAKDACCFTSGHALPPLMATAEPFFRLYGKGHALRSHVNFTPGTHNYEQDNREAFYKMVGDFFLPNATGYSAKEIDCAKEVRHAKDLAVPMPEKNEDFNSLAKAIAKNLPRDASLPKDEAAKNARRDLLKRIVKYHELPVEAKSLGNEEAGGVRVSRWSLAAGKEWHVPIVELSKPNPKDTVIVIHDGGRAVAAGEIQKQVDAGNRVLAVDPFYWGECTLPSHAYLFALLQGTVGERPLGVQASQIAAVARWSRATHKAPVRVVAAGNEISGLVALVSAAVDPDAIVGFTAAKSYKSLKDVLEQNIIYQNRPELFCFGLLEHFDVPQMEALARQ
jgi:hypothetical protein